MVLAGYHFDVDCAYPGVGINTKGYPVLVLKSNLVELR